MTATAMRPVAAISVPAVDRKVTADLGVALMPDDALTDKDLLRRADRALYTATRNGRTRSSRPTRQ
jgi:GGDEF domain-containing protein